jgi:VCBS repeat-containing protein
VEEGNDGNSRAAEPLVEGNAFAANSGAGLEVGSGGPTIRDNVFAGNEEEAVVLSPYDGQASSAPVLRENHIEDNSIGISISGSLPPDLGTSSEYGLNVIQNNSTHDVENTSSDTIQAVGNYWGTTSASAIDNNIYDDDEDSGSGPVVFDPFLNAPPEDGNVPPVASPDSFSVAADSTLMVGVPGVLGNDTDANGDSLTAALVSGVSDGTLTLGEDGSFEYVPDSGFSGTDGFLYEAADSSAADSAAVTISVESVNESPVARADSFQTVEDSALVVEAPGVLENDSDPDGDSLAAVLVSGPSSGALSLDADGSFEYEPDSAFSGTDGFLYEVADSSAADSAAVTITVESVNESPVARADSFQTVEDSALVVEAPGVLENDSDPDGDSLTAALVSGPSSGALSLDADGSFEYAPSAGVVGSDAFTYEASDGTASDTATVHIQVGEGMLTRSIPLADGWNLISVPLETQDPTFGAVLPPCENGFFFAPGSGYTGISDGEAVPPGQGFFANCSDGTVQITGAVSDSQTVAVETGWNVIGPFADSVDVESINSTPPGIVETSFFGFSTGGGYVGASALSPGGGYWVKAGEAGTLDLSGSGGSGAALAAKALASPQPTTSETTSEKTGPRLILRDAAGREATLRFVEERSEATQAQYALPPPPPGDVFDVRFANGRSAVPINREGGTEDAVAIETQGLSAPIDIRLNGASPEQVLRIERGAGLEGTNARLTTEEPSVELSSATDLRVSVEPLPETFALGKSAPNPVRRRATVEYALPEQAEVTISVYDVLGRRVARLVDRRKRPGRYSVRLDARQLPSGTYFVRMRAGPFSKTRRLTVVR